MVWSLIVPHEGEADQECRKNANTEQEARKEGKQEKRPWE